MDPVEDYGDNSIGEMHIIGVTKKELARLEKEFAFQPMTENHIPFYVHERGFALWDHDESTQYRRVNGFNTEDIFD